MNLEEARDAPAITDEDVAQAEAEAAEAAELHAELERRALEDAKPPKPSEVVEQRELSRFASQRAARTRDLAARAKAAKRLTDLDQVGKDVAALAAESATPHAGIVKAAKDLQAAAARLTELCEQHDSKVADLVSRARDLDVEPPAPSGPRATSAHVALVPRYHAENGGLRAGGQSVHIVGKRAAEAIQLAIGGDADAAVARIGAVHHPKAPERADRYYLGANGVVTTQSGPETQAFADQVRRGDLQRLSDDQVELYLAGRLDNNG